MRDGGKLWNRVSEKGAKKLLDLEWAVRRESKGRAYLALTEKAPVSTILVWRGGSRTTRPVFADHSCRTYKAGQRMGHKFNLEFRG